MAVARLNTGKVHRDMGIAVTAIAVVDEMKDAQPAAPGVGVWGPDLRAINAAGFFAIGKKHAMRASLDRASLRRFRVRLVA